MAKAGRTFRGVAVDVGNSAIHVGWFDGAEATLPQPGDVLYLNNGALDISMLAQWVSLHVAEPVTWRIASVNHRAADKLTNWLQAEHTQHAVRRITHQDSPVAIRVEQPEKVGVDRLMAVTAAQHLVGSEPAIVIDAGTAVTVDLLAENAFQGGAILPGMQMSAAALDRYTDKLPMVQTVGMDTPDAIGRNTLQAMQAGIFWGTVGAVGELTRRLTASLEQTPRIFVTGGDGRALAPHIHSAEYVSDLVLSGIALIGERRDG